MYYERRVRLATWVQDEMRMLKAQRELDLKEHPYEIDVLRFTEGRICELEKVVMLFRVDTRSR
jgi:hypothetical protein